MTPDHGQTLRRRWLVAYLALFAGGCVLGALGTTPPQGIVVYGQHFAFVLFVLVLGALLAFALVAVTFNTIRLQILTQRAEIEVAKLIGATNPFIRRPFLYYGAVLGLAGGLTAWAITAIGLTLLNTRLAELAQLYGSSFALQSLPLSDAASLCLFAAGLGWLGAWLSASRNLVEFDPD